MTLRNFADARIWGHVPDSFLSWNCRRSATSGYQCVPLGVLAKVMRNEERGENQIRTGDRSMSCYIQSNWQPHRGVEMIKKGGYKSP